MRTKLRTIVLPAMSVGSDGRHLVQGDREPVSQSVPDPGELTENVTSQERRGSLLLCEAEDHLTVARLASKFASANQCSVGTGGKVVREVGLCEHI